MTNPLDTPLEGEPTGPLVAGDTWIWLRTDLITDYPFSSYTLSYDFKREGDATSSPITVTASKSNGTYQTTVPSSTTETMTPGDWAWSGYMTRTSDSARLQIASGVIRVVADGATSTADPRGHARRMLNAIEALLENRATGDVNSYSIAGRSLTKMNVAELTRWRNYYRREVNAASVTRFTVARFNR